MESFLRSIDKFFCGAPLDSHFRQRCRVVPARIDACMEDVARPCIAVV
jgi:hypothetical protein